MVGRLVHSEIISLIERAQAYVVLVSPFVRLWPELTRAIARSGLRGVRFQAIVRPDQDEVQLRDLGVDVITSPGMHQKAYLSESQAIHTSANLTAGSVGRSSESALCVDRDIEPDIWAVVCDQWHQAIDEEIRKVEAASATDWTRTGSAVEPTGTRHNRCISCGSWAWREGFPPDGELDLWVVCLTCRLQSFAAGDDWLNRRGRYCTSCGTTAEVSVEKPRCRKCWERDKASHGAADPHWYIRAKGDKQLELWSASRLEGGATIFHVDHPQYDRLEERWPHFMRGDGWLTATITAMGRQRLNPMEVALPRSRNFHVVYDNLLVQRSRNTQPVPCDGIPSLGQANHIHYHEAPEPHPDPYWEIEQTLATWDVVLVGIDRPGSASALPLQVQAPLLLSGRQTLRATERLPEPCFLRVEMSIGLPETFREADRPGVVSTLLELMLAALHTFDPDKLLALWGDSGELSVKLAQALSTPGPLGHGALRRGAKGRVVGWPMRADRLAVVSVTHESADHFTLKGAVQSLRPRPVH